jgi:hypothetical protein
MAHSLSAPKPVGGFTLTGKKGQLIAKETYEWWLTADSDNPTYDSILATPGFPVPYQALAQYGMCTDSSCDRVPGKRRLWKVSASFSSDIDSDGNSGTNPVSWTPVRETYLEPYQEVELRDKDGKAYTNGTGTPFASAPSVDKDNLRWDFYQFDPITVTDTNIRDVNNTINDATYLGCAKHTLLLKIRKSTVGYWYRTNLRLTEYSLIWKESDWNEKMANVGNSFCIDGTMYPYRYVVLDADGNFDKTSSQAVHTGPLGNRDVPVNTAYVKNTGGTGIIAPADVEDDGPSGGAVYMPEMKAWYANEPPENTLFYVSRRKFNELSFSSILRF